MDEDIKSRKNNQSVIAHVEMYQSLISRMAANSSSCKTWCIMLITAILAMYTTKEDHNIRFLLICAFPIILFYLLDSYYLGLERSFRKTIKKFVEDINSDKTSEWEKEIFMVSSVANRTKNTP